MREVTAKDRRSKPRFHSEAFSARIRLKGQFSRFSVQVLDFNRHGLAICIERPLPKNQLVFISLDDGRTSLPRVVGVVHNCLPHAAGYRCGIRFRTQSSLQFDREMVEAHLADLEVELAALEPELAALETALSGDGAQSK